jgi:AcrR family transcriptional regulator
MARRSDIDGRELLIAAALKLFAEEGIDGVSIRAINREAGLGPASVHYHFGTKDALVEAVLHVHGDQIVDAVTQRAQALVDSEAPITARDLVQMLALPYIDLISSHTDTGHDWIKLVSQTVQSDADRVTDRTSLKVTAQAAARAYPDSTPAQRQRALRMCFTLLVTQLAQFGEGASARGRAKGRLDLDLLIDFLSGGLDSALRSTSPAQAAESA